MGAKKFRSPYPPTTVAVGFELFNSLSIERGEEGRSINGCRSNRR